MRVELTKGKLCPIKKSFFGRKKCTEDCAFYVTQPFNVIKTDKSGKILTFPNGEPQIEEKELAGCVMCVNHKLTGDMSSSLNALSQVTVSVLGDVVNTLTTMPGRNIVKREAIPPHLQEIEE